MYLKLKENRTFTIPETNIVRTATNEDYPIAKIYNLSLRSEGNDFVGDFELLFYWDMNARTFFYKEFAVLTPEIINQYRTISIPSGRTEIDIAQTIQALVYGYLQTTFEDWELVLI
jgi:hypothetical protein